MPECYATSHRNVYALAKYSLVHSSGMDPHLLIAELVHRTGKSTLQVAKEMHNASFQGTLHKYMSGGVKAPSRGTAEKIARYFNLPVDALYESTVAQRVAAERGIAITPPAPGMLVAREPSTVVRAKSQHSVVPERMIERIARLSPEDRSNLLHMMDRFLSGFETLEAQSRKAQGA